jgi:hypothetical protein
MAEGYEGVEGSMSSGYVVGGEEGATTGGRINRDDRLMGESVQA